MPPSHPPPPPVPATPASDPETRRAALRVQANPGERVDYRVILSRSLGGGGAGALRMTVEYVPDRVILVPDSLTRYVAGLEHLSWPGPEALGVAILDDINNEVVPRWLRVTVMAGPETRPDEPGSDAAASRDPLPHDAPWHAVILEDRQPHWTTPNPAPIGSSAAR